MRATIAVFRCLCIALGLSASLGSYAQSSANKACEEKPKAGGTLSESTYVVVERAVADFTEERYEKAEEQLLDLTEKVKDYERAIVFQTLGYVYAQQDRLGDALQAFEEALALDVLPREPQENLMLNTGQIYLAEGNLDKGIELLERYLKRACREPSSLVHIALASAYAEQQRYKEALQQVKLGILKAEQVQESWLQLKLALHYEMNQLPECGETLLQLIAMAPGKADYWRQLSGVMMQIENEVEALAILAIAEREGFLSDEREIKNLANIYLMLNIPYKAGKLINQYLDSEKVAVNSENYEYLSEAWIAAREWSEAENSLRRAAQLSSKGELWQRLAQVQMEQENWQGAKSSLEAALNKGVDKRAKTNYLLGVAAFYAGDKKIARKAFREALRDETVEREARQWLDHLAQENNRRTSQVTTEAAEG